MDMWMFSISTSGTHLTLISYVITMPWPVELFFKTMKGSILAMVSCCNYFMIVPYNPRSQLYQNHQYSLAYRLQKYLVHNQQLITLLQQTTKQNSIG